MTEALKLSVVAEGIETEAQFEYYRKIGMPMVVQGWPLGYPAASQESREMWLAKVEEMM